MNADRGQGPGGERLARHLYDIQGAVRLLAGFVVGRTWQEHERDAVRRAAVERQVENIGEALAQLAKRDASLAGRIGGYRRTIGFRNVLMHGYAEVDDRLVWGMVEMRLPRLREQVDALAQARWDHGFALHGPCIVRAEPHSAVRRHVAAAHGRPR